jgi:hypothetical protein
METTLNYKEKNFYKRNLVLFFKTLKVTGLDKLSPRQSHGQMLLTRAIGLCLQPISGDTEICCFYLKNQAPVFAE